MCKLYINDIYASYLYKYMYICTGCALRQVQWPSFETHTIKMHSFSLRHQINRVF